jgi:hexosaminidase
MISIAILLCGAWLQQLHAQTSTVFDPSKLKIELTMLERGFQGKDQALAEFSIVNSGDAVIPSTGWSLYFNFKNSIILKPGETQKLNVEQLNGNLFRIRPAKGFIPLKPRQRFTAAVLVDEGIKKVTDEPEGFYVVKDNDLEKGIPVRDVKINNGLELQDNETFGRILYERNAELAKVTPGQRAGVFPLPLSYKENGTAFLLGPDVRLVADVLFEKEAKGLTSDLRAMFGQKFSFQGLSGKRSIVLKRGTEVPEGYTLEINSDSILISASDNAGIFHGIQSLKTLMPPQSFSGLQSLIAIPGVLVKDAPRFHYRGLMLDVARNFQTKKEVLKVLDLMALYKLNVFHFHLSDDEGWRLEIAGLPELTSVGARRGHSLDSKKHLPPAYGSGADPGLLYGSGFYTRADFVEILRYATERHIQVIPEVESPGHARAAIKAMDARYARLMAEDKPNEARMYLLKDADDQSVYSTPQRWHDNVIDVSLPSSYTFMKKVVDEIEHMYVEAGVTLKTLHIGGDEVPQGAWEKSPSCEAFLKAHPEVGGTDGLWYEYLTRVQDLLSSRGIQLAGWEEVALRKTRLNGQKVTIVNPDFIHKNFSLYVWNNINGNEDLAYKLANAGYPVVLTFVSNFYFDMATDRTYQEPGYYWGGLIDLNKTFGFVPFDDRHLTDYGKSNVKGIQGAIWSETIKGPERLEYMLLPRLLALAERAWSKEQDWEHVADPKQAGVLYAQSWSDFVHVLAKRELPRLNYYKGGFAYRIPMAGLTLENDVVLANTEPGSLDIRYTVNGEDPTIKSNLYTRGIPAKGLLKFRVFDPSGRSGQITIMHYKNK